MTVLAIPHDVGVVVELRTRPLSSAWRVGFLIPLCAVFLGGCADTHTGPEIPPSGDPQFSAEGAPVILGATRARMRTYYCSISRRGVTRDALGSAQYEYGLLRFRYSERDYAAQAGGDEVDFIVRVDDDAGEIEWAAWCHVPRSQASAQRVLARLGLTGEVSTRHVLSRPSPRRRIEEDRINVEPMWNDGDDEEEDGRCGPGEYWNPEAGACQAPIDLPPIIVDPPPGGPPPPPDPDPDPWPDPEPEDPPGGGGGDDGGGGMPPEPPPPGDDCEAGEACEEEDVADFLYNIFEVEVDTTYVPVCPPESETRHLYRPHAYAWCNAQAPDTITQLPALNTALDRIEARGGVCVEIAQTGRTLLQSNNIKVFTENVFPSGVKPTGGLGVKGHGIRLHADWFELLDHTSGYRTWEVNLEFTVVHEIEHYLNGPSHITPPGAPGYYDETENARLCSGL